MTCRTVGTVCLGLVVLMALGPAIAQQVEPTSQRVVGDVLFVQATMEGPTVTTTDNLEAGYITTSPGEGGDAGGFAAGELEIDVASVVVNWTYMREREVGFSPSNPNESLVAVTMENTTDEQAFMSTTLTIPYESRDVDVLVAPRDGDVSLEANLSVQASTLTASPADQVTWEAGAATENTHSQTGPSLTNTFDLHDGHPVLTSGTSQLWTIEGDVALYVWGANVTVEPDGGEPETYRSGRWWTDRIGQEVHPRGVTGVQHSQFLRVYADGASLSLRHDRGSAQWSAEHVELSTNGTAAFESARAFLESSEFVYSAQEETFQIEGLVEQSMGTEDGDVNRLESIVRAEEAQVSLPPSGRADGGAGGVGDLEDPTAPTSGDAVPVPAPGMIGEVLVLVGVAGAVLGGAWVTWGRDRDGKELSSLERSELALVERNPREARRHARKVLDQNPNDPDAWLLYGASLVKERHYDRVVTELEPVAERFDRDPGLGFVLALAYAHLGDEEGVVRWGKVAVEVAALRHELRLDPAMEPYLDLAPFQTYTGAGGEEVAYT